MNSLRPAGSDLGTAFPSPRENSGCKVSRMLQCDGVGLSGLPVASWRGMPSAMRSQTFEYAAVG